MANMPFSSAGSFSFLPDQIFKQVESSMEETTGGAISLCLPPVVTLMMKRCFFIHSLHKTCTLLVSQRTP